MIKVHNRKKYPQRLWMKTATITQEILTQFFV